MTTYRKMFGYNGRLYAEKTDDNGSITGFPLPNIGEDDSLYRNPAYEQYLRDIASGIIPIEPSPIPLRYSEYQEISPIRLVTTTNAATELVRYTLSPSTMYVARLELEVINLTDTGIPVRHIEAVITAKRIAAGALLVSTPTILVDQPDVAGTIPVSAAVAGNDFIIRVTGITGKTINWFLSGRIKIITQAGK